MYVINHIYINTFRLYIIYIYILKNTCIKTYIYIYLHFNLNSYEKTYTCKYYKVSSGCRML